MNRAKAIEQLQDLIKDREAFLIGGGDTGDEIFRKDIAALERAIFALQHEKIGSWIDAKKQKPKKYETVLVRIGFSDTEARVVVIGKWNGMYWETADTNQTHEIYTGDCECFVDAWMAMPRE